MKLMLGSRIRLDLSKCYRCFVEWWWIDGNKEGILLFRVRRMVGGNWKKLDFFLKGVYFI